MELIAARSKEGEFPKVHVFTTFFYPKLQKEGYSNILKRWTRKVIQQTNLAQHLKLTVLAKESAL